MKQMTSQKDRQRFYELHQAGRTYQQIADEFGVSLECVRLWCRRQKAGGGVENRYYNPRAGTLSQFSPRVRQRIEELRRAHPHWGAASLLLQLGKAPDLAEEALPSRASIGRFLHTFTEFRRQRPKKPPADAPTPPSGCISAG
jgi:transposase